jgi:hypothetical protein
MTDIQPWTPPMDARLHRLRREGAPWRVVAAELRLSQQAVRARGRHLGLPEWSQTDIPGYPTPADDPYRPALPVGHERAWRILTDGTALEGTAADPVSST